MNYKIKRLCALLGSAVILSSAMTACSWNTGETTEKSVSQDDSKTDQNGIYTYEDMFTDKDLTGEFDENKAVHIVLADNATTVTESGNTESTDVSGGSSVSGVSVDGNVITITKEQTYIISGTLSQGQIIVDADDAKVQLVLDNASITCNSGAAIYVKNADKTFITLADNSQNSVINTNGYTSIDDNNIDAVIFSKDDLTFNGEGSLTVNAAYGHGIVSKDDLKFTGGNYNITAEKHALSGKDSVRIADGTFDLTAGKDGIHSENSDDTEKGFVYIAGGEFTVNAAGDGIDAFCVVQVDNGKFDIVSGGGSENSTKKHAGIPSGGFAKPDGNTDTAPDGSSNSKPDGGTDAAPGGSPNAKSDESADAAPDGSPNSKPGDNSDAAGDGNRPQPPQKPGGQGNEKTPEDISDIPQTESTDNNRQNDADMAERPDADSEAETEDTVSTKGIKADGKIYILNGEYKINSADDSVHSNSDVIINNGTFTISTGDDGVHSDEALVINGGTITVNQSYEGLEGLTVKINGGNIDITADDDGINAAGGADSGGFGAPGNDRFAGSRTDTGTKDDDNQTDDTSDNDMWMEINGGIIHVLAAGDGLDSNGDLTINGGEISIDGPSDNGNSAIDYGDRASAYVNEGTLVAVGSSGMAEKMSDSSKQQVLFVKLDSQQQAGNIKVTDSDGNEIISYTAKKSYDCVIISTGVLKSGQTYTLNASGAEKQITL